MDLTEEYHNKEMVKDFIKSMVNEGKPDTMIPLTDGEIETARELIQNEINNVGDDFENSRMEWEEYLDDLWPLLKLERKLRFKPL